MSAQQLLLLAGAAMVGLMALRLFRLSRGLEPSFEGTPRLLFRIAFLILPPIALGAAIDPSPASGPLRGTSDIPLYIVALILVAIPIWIAALLVRTSVHGPSRRVLLIALIGSDPSQGDLPVDPPVTARLAESLAVVDTANAAFPRGPAFPEQIHRPDFREAWDALDAATVVLESQIADDRRLGLGVASIAADTAQDARSRLNTLRRLAADRVPVPATT